MHCFASWPEVSRTHAPPWRCTERTRMVRRLAILVTTGLIGLAIAFLIFAVAERQSGKRRLARTLTAIEQAGEVMDISELRPPRIPDASNAWSALLRFTNRLAVVPDAMNSLPTVWIWATPGALLPLGSETNGVSVATTERDQSSAGDSLRNSLTAAQDLREQIHDAMARPDFDSQFAFSQGFFELPGDTTVLVAAGKWLHAEACLGLMDGDAPAFKRALGSMLRLLRHQSRQPLMIGQLTRQGLTIRAMGLTVHGINDERLLTPSDLSELRDAWDRFNILSDFESAFRMERAIALQHFQILGTDPARRQEALGWAGELRKVMEVEAESPWQRFWRSWIQEPLWPWLWADHDLAWSLTQWNERIAAARRARVSYWDGAAFDISALDVRSGFLKDVPMEGVRGPSLADRIRCRFSLGGPELFPDHHYFRTAYRAEVARRLVVAALQVHSFKRDHGSWPKSLVEAFAGAGGGVGPLDPMDGRPLRYRRQDNEAGFILYSVGTDGKDDGGSTEVEDQEGQYRTPFDGKDWVWPRLVEPLSTRSTGPDRGLARPRDK